MHFTGEAVCPIKLGMRSQRCEIILDSNDIKPYYSKTFTNIHWYSQMNQDQLVAQANSYLQKLCIEISERVVGSEGNRLATDFFQARLKAVGFEIEEQEFDCFDWKHGDARLTVKGEEFTTFISPYSLACDVAAGLVVVSNVEDLESVEASGKIMLLKGDIAREQLMPKNFTFYNPGSHKRIISLLEAKNPLAIIGSTSQNPELAGAVYPFPLIEDGDFDIPSVYLTDVEGERLAAFAGREVSLSINSKRIPAKGKNIVARKGVEQDGKIVLCAHIDSKDGTPGALDDASGIVTLLILAELLKDYAGVPTIEIVALNGEDHYSAAGQMEYLRRMEGRFDQISLVINLDIVGYLNTPTAFSFYGCTEEVTDKARRAFLTYEDIKEGDLWYQGDHMIFVGQGRPAIAITSEKFEWLCANVTHTSKDVPELVDCEKVVDVAMGLKNLLETL